MTTMFRMIPSPTLLLLSLLLASANPAAQGKLAAPYFGIQVIDAQTGRGVPLVELRTVNGMVLHTDSGGWIAFHEPGLMEREVYFGVQGPGYEHAKDGFGFRGVRLKTSSGATATVKVQRVNIAERLYRVTGQGIYRDTTLLGLKTPISAPNLAGGVVGQDSVQAVPYRGKLFWMWGDTSVPRYPLGNFQTTAAWSPLPGKEGCKPGSGIALDYITDPKQGDGLLRMAPLPGPGVVWLFGLLTVADEQGREALLAHFTRRKSLAEQVEHGLVRFDDEAGVFKKVATLELGETWRYPRGNAVRVREASGEFFYFAAPFCHARVPATWSALFDPKKYEALTYNTAAGDYSWQADLPPTTQANEQKLLKSGKLRMDQARYQLVDALSGRPVVVHGGSVAWNDYRKKWILIGVQSGSKETQSLLGEVWYAEADTVAGPWRKAIKVASHPKYSFYNPRHHAFFDEKGGRIIYFEGTYTHTFSGNPVATPRYDYNQIMYRLDLADERLKSER